MLVKKMGVNALRRCHADFVSASLFNQIIIFTDCDLNNSALRLFI